MNGGGLLIPPPAAPALPSHSRDGAQTIPRWVAQMVETHGSLTDEIVVLSMKHIVSTFLQNEDNIGRCLAFFGE